MRPQINQVFEDFKKIFYDDDSLNDLWILETQKVFRKLGYFVELESNPETLTLLIYQLIFSKFNEVFEFMDLIKEPEGGYLEVENEDDYSKRL